VIRPTIEGRWRWNGPGRVRKGCRQCAGRWREGRRGRQASPHLDRGWYYEITLLRDVENSMFVAQLKIFSLVTALISYRDLDDAIRRRTTHGGLRRRCTRMIRAGVIGCASTRSGGVALNLLESRLRSHLAA
jgi:hypothetical protein